MFKITKLPQLFVLNSKWKNKSTLFYVTSKVGQSKVLLFFHFEVKTKSCGHFVILNNSVITSAYTKNSEPRRGIWNSFFLIFFCHINIYIYIIIYTSSNSPASLQGPMAWKDFIAEIERTRWSHHILEGKKSEKGLKN